MNEKNNKQKILLLTRTLGRAGVGMSLIPVLQSLDLSRFDVTLGVQFPIKELEPEVPEGIRVVYYGEVTSPLYRRVQALNARLKGKGGLCRFFWHVLNHVEEWRMVYKVHRCFPRRYDTATAYHQGMASRYVMRHIRARRKVLWYHAAKVEQPWYKTMFAKADAIVTDSENARQVLLEAWGESFTDKITAMHCILPTDELTQKAAAPLPPLGKEGQTVLLSCGRLESEKGMDLTVEAAAILRDTLPHFDFVWVLVGDGSQADAIRRLIEEKGLTERVKMAGYQSNPYPYFAACDVYVQPSRLECFGITIAEALYFGKPVISTKSAGGTEQIEDGVNGLLTDISAESLAAAVTRFVTDEALSEGIRQRVRQEDYAAVRARAAAFVNEIHGA